MSVVAIITARGGSKRIPKKNIKEFCGKPIIAYSIEAAIRGGCFDEVMVSTDSKEIADIASKYGAKVPFMRSANNSNDFATTSDVILEVLESYKQMGISFDYACCIYPTAPFVTSEKLRFSMEKLIHNSDIDTVMPVVRFSFPPQRGLVIEDGYARMKDPENANKRSQDLQPMYHDAGQFYCINVSKFIEAKNILTGKVCPIECSELEVQDIDNEVDWKLAEIKYSFIREEQNEV